MPAFITHYLYGVDIFHSSKSKLLKQTVSEHRGPYGLGLQGPDIFFYYIPSMIGLKANKMGNLMHETKVSGFFQNYIYYMNQLSEDAYSIALSYLYGIIAHNILDTCVHPYVYSRANYRPESKLPKKYYFGMHGEIETCIDFLLLQRKKQLRPSDFHPYNTIDLTQKELNVVSHVLAKTINKTYVCDKGKRVTPSIIKQAFFSTKMATILLHSRFGIRKKLIHALEQTFFHYNIIATTVNYNGIKDIYDAMNSKHRIWQNPWNPKLISDESFDELYEKAICKFQLVANRMEAYVISSNIKKKDTIKPLLKELGNFSYHSGLDCDLENCPSPH